MLNEMNKEEQAKKIKEIIDDKNAKTMNVIFAFDISSNNMENNNVKTLLKMLSTMVIDYNCNEYFITFDDKIKDEYKLDTIEEMELDLKSDSGKCKYESIIKHVEEKYDIEKLFKLIIITDGNGEQIFENNFDILWITSNKDFNPNIGEKFLL